MRFSQKIITFLAAGAITLGLAGANLFHADYAAASGAVEILIDGQTVPFTQDSGFPFIDDASRTQVPLRAAMEAYGCQVQWDNANRTADITKDGITVQVPIGQPYILVNGKQIPNDTAALIQHDRTYLPIRAVLEAFGGYVTWDGERNAVTVDTTAPVLHVYFIDVGQGDATLIDFGETEVLIDGGDRQAGGTVVSSIAPYVDGTLDYIVATHPDADHIGGLTDVISAFDVGEIIESGYSSSSAAYHDYLSAALAEPGCTLSYDETRSIPLGGQASLQVIETGDDYNNPNDNSVITQLVYGGTTVLLTGDMSQTVETACLHLFSDVDVLKVGHHGSGTSTSDAFLDVVKPEYAVVSYGAGNKYGHPTSAALSRLINRSVTVYGTAKSGTIVLSTNGKDYTLQASAPLSLADAGGDGASLEVSHGVTRAEAACVGSTSTKKYHTFACRYVNQISQSNLIYFSSDAAAQSAGYEGCKVCQ